VQVYVDIRELRMEVLRRYEEISRPRATTVLLMALLAAGCGARTSLVVDDKADETSTGSASSGDASPPERSCLPNCTFGHQCCIGGCGGPPAVTENDCCTCLPGEVSSQECDDFQCQ
jgi:hypothetical protein